MRCYFIASGYPETYPSTRTPHFAARPLRERHLQRMPPPLIRVCPRPSPEHVAGVLRSSSAR